MVKKFYLHFYWKKVGPMNFVCSFFVQNFARFYNENVEQYNEVSEKNQCFGEKDLYLC